VARPFLVCLTLLLAAVGAGCAEPSENASEASGTAGKTEALEDIAFGESLAQIRGHHLVSLELYRAGDVKGAAVHAGHPIAEILDSIQAELDESDPRTGERLAVALDRGARAVSESEPAVVVASAYARAATLTELALLSAIGEETRTSSYRGSVVAALVATAGHEYEEAVGPQGIRLVAEYQDAYAFVREARRLYGGIESDVKQSSAEEAEEIEEAFGTLESALPRPTPPRHPIDVLEVESAARLIGHELEETVDATPVEESDPDAVAAEIEELLEDIVIAYEAGDADEAAELSAEAYLENYEVIEAEVIEQAPDVNQELEPLLGATLRRQIMEGAPTAEIKEMTARAQELLSEALDAIGEH
jgi:hypothetical protein